MTPQEIGDDYQCAIHVTSYRFSGKVEYELTVSMEFKSKVTMTKAKTHWTCWRSFSKFYKLDEHMRKRNQRHMKGIIFPRRYRAKNFLGTNKRAPFLEARRTELDTYIQMVTRAPEIVAFHRMTVQCQSLRSFINYAHRFGEHSSYAAPTSTPVAVVPLVDNYSWSGTGFRASRSTHTDRRHSRSMSYRSDRIPPQLEAQRAKMEQQLVDEGLVGVGMPPDGSCFLHCLVYEMYPLKCLDDYPADMLTVNVGAADGRAPRRIRAAKKLRHTLSDYALQHVVQLSQFLMQPIDELRRRYLRFRNCRSEQATVAELYAAASMFNLEIQLVTNDPTFRVDPVVPIRGLPSVRTGGLRILILGYLIPADGLAGHYICTQEYSRPSACDVSFTGGCYRGSISVKPPAYLTDRRSLQLDRVSLI